MQVSPDVRAELDRVLLLQDKCLPVIRPCLLRERSQRIFTVFQLRELRIPEPPEQLPPLHSALQIPVGHFLDMGVRDGIDQARQLLGVFAIEGDLQDLGSRKKLGLQILREPVGRPRSLADHLELVDPSLLERGVDDESALELDQLAPLVSQGFLPFRLGVDGREHDPWCRRPHQYLGLGLVLRGGKQKPGGHRTDTRHQDRQSQRQCQPTFECPEQTHRAWAGGLLGINDHGISQGDLAGSITADGVHDCCNRRNRSGQLTCDTICLVHHR